MIMSPKAYARLARLIKQASAAPKETWSAKVHGALVEQITTTSHTADGWIVNLMQIESIWLCLKLFSQPVLWNLW